MTEALLAILFIVVAFKVANSLNANNEETAGREAKKTRNKETEKQRRQETKKQIPHGC